MAHTVSSADKLATDFYNNEEGSSVSITVDGSIIPSLKILFLWGTTEAGNTKGGSITVPLTIDLKCI